jgi:hypothetical protein
MTQLRAVKPSLDELLAGADSREPWKTADSLSGSLLERVRISDERYVLKHLHLDDDWIQRANGDLYTRPLVMWRSGMLDALPDPIDHTIADVAGGLGRNGWGAAVLMTDVSECLVDVSAPAIRHDQHLRFLDHMAGLHAQFWGFRDELGLMPFGNRYFMLSPLMAACESDRGTLEGVPGMVVDGWRRMAGEAPELGRILLRLLDEPWPLVGAQQDGPQTLIHGDWKAGNLGSHPDGRTILLDWAFPGEAPAALDLAWYIAVNCDLLPESKEDTISNYRDALERHGVGTDGWWDAQLELGLLGAVLLLGWSKTGEELAWWADRAPRAVRYLI